jgi:hypothetical protein
VASDESPSELLDRADLVLEGSAAVPGFLETLLAGADAGTSADT